jgi:holo-[acyl-carrier protein] synthase
MVLGIGTDLFEIARMEEELRSDAPRLAEQIFTAAEIAYCSARRHPARHFAARFAAKEALLKALSTDHVDLSVWREIEVLHAPGGRPEITLHGRMKERAGTLRVRRILVSLTHTPALASASVVLED